MRSLAVYLNATRVGTLHETNDLWSFEYEVSWQESPNGFDLSPALPRSTRLYQDGAVNGGQEPPDSGVGLRF